MTKPFRLPGFSRLSGLSELSGARRFLVAAASFAVVIAVAAAVIAPWPRQAPKHLVAYFPEATGLYTGDRVLVLGVPVGQVEAITPQDGRVKVEMSYDASVRVPAGAKAAIITPTLVTTRYVQLTPAYTRGAVMADGAAIPQSRTAVPVEWDQIEKELNTLAAALGPHAAHRGALNKLLTTAAANLNGQGQNMHDTLTALTNASATLSGDRGDLFATLDNLQEFVSVLQQANGQVGTFEQRLDSVSATLAGNKQELAGALSALNSSLGTVRGFVQGNRNALSASLTSVNDVVGNLAASDQTIANILQVAPTQVANFNNIYDPVDHAITGTLSLTNFQNPAEFICSTIFDVGGTPAQCQQALAPYLKLLQMNQVSASVDPVNRDGYGSHSSQAGSASPGSTASKSPGSGPGGLLNLLLGGGS